MPNGGNLRPTRRFGSVDEYNAAAKKVMMASGVAINDLNAAIAPHLATMQRATDVHFTSEGSALLAKHVARSIEAQLDTGLRTSAASSASRPPNVIFVLADDQGWGDSGHNGHPCARTPHLDQLAESRFFHDGTVSSATRLSSHHKHAGSEQAAAVVSGPGDSLRHNGQEQADEDPFTMPRAAFDRAIAFAEEHADKPFYLHV